MFLSLISCREAVARLDDYLDRALSPREQTLLARHFKICSHCAQIFQFEADLLNEMQEKLQRVEMPPHLKEKIFAALPDQTPLADQTSAD